MQRIGLWQILGTSLTRVPATSIDLEESLEEWIACDPSLIQADLVIVARQLTTEAGRLDLLGIDPQGRWTIIEIKRGTVSRDTIAQGLDYTSVIATLPEDEIRALLADQLASRNLSLDTLLEERDAIESFDPEEREVALALVGTARSPGLERMSSFFARRSTVPLSIICFDAFELSDGRIVLAREVTESAETSKSVGPRAAIPTSDVVELAHRSGTGPDFERILHVATSLGLYPRTYKTSIMYTSPENRATMLFTVWARPERGCLKLWLSHENFAEFYPTTMDEVAQYLGSDGRRHLDPAKVEEFIGGLERLFKLIRERSSSQSAVGKGDV
jgi:Endonuclease NucS C-terminal domain